MEVFCFLREYIVGGQHLMEEKKKEKNILTLVIITILFCGSVSALATPTLGIPDGNLTRALEKQALSQQASEGYVILLDENFTDGNMPPKGLWGDWVLHQTNANQTWFIDTTSPHTDPFCATIRRNGTLTAQDEWLITPSLDFSQYAKIYLDLFWYTCYYVTVHKRYVEFNVSISLDGGGNWTTVWCFNDVGKFFNDWKWYKSILPNNVAIDLSTYAGNTNVKIAFQYYSNSTNSADYQEFSLDTIIVYASDPVTMECNAGGPYEWWWPMQFEYQPNGVRFRGTAKNAPVTAQWLWDFGDGNTSITPFFATHLYTDIGTYNVTLTVKDTLASPPRVAFDTTTIRLFLTKPPEMDLIIKKPSLGISIDIKNNGQYNATFVNWTMKIFWGPLQIIEKEIAQDVIENITKGSTVTIRSPYYFFGFGRIHVIVSIVPENLPDVVKHYHGLKVGPLVFIYKES